MDLHTQLEQALEQPNPDIMGIKDMIGKLLKADRGSKKTNELFVGVIALFEKQVAGLALEELFFATGPDTPEDTLRMQALERIQLKAQAPAEPAFV